MTVIKPIPGYDGYTVSSDGTVYSKSGNPLSKRETKKVIIV